MTRINPAHLAAYVWLALAVLNAVFAAVNFDNLKGDWGDPAIMVVAAFLTYHGWRWAMLMAVVYWTYCKGFQTVDAIDQADVWQVIVQLIGLVAIVWATGRAFLAEMARAPA